MNPIKKPSFLKALAQQDWTPRGLWISFSRLLRLNYLRILRLKASAHSIALGAALGIFVGCLPIIPFQTVLVITLAFIFRANKIAAFSCTWITNAFNVIPFYYMLYKVGSHILPFAVEFNPHLLSLQELFDQGWRLTVLMTAGGFVVGIPSSIAMYFLSLRAVLTYRRRRAMRLLKKRQHHHHR
ncbi:DUF2062 domain-containing protein [Oceanidesulfovibrio indonesiensis]|uniref:DUF2062 domain-containing protein n=1 Tax=Oceanidesulfovibrio indonesiensis TaxID=54767 RepID=A0A7M3MCS1_9BACT|nr:DUF2062 domain-containing protein [Oceanidesulfovibrio indonesiensis]TVM15837.1 DUF2062 domain-containing protein [Oceanidesulfovibrio indonesiensis]